MIGGIYFAAAPFAGLVVGPAGIALAAAAQITIAATAAISPPPAYFDAAATITITAARADLQVPIDTTAGIVVGGVPVTGRVRLASLTIRDVLNDAPNTCAFVMEGDGPAVGQSVRVTMGTRLLFTGAVQTVDQSYESRPDLVAWQVTAIDDTGEANARRPFGTWVDTSASTIAQALTATYAPGFSSAGVAAGLPAVSIVFDGADTFIACLARLASAVGGYCKIEDHVVHLFTADTSDPPAPIDPDHRFLANPPIQMNVDASQLRTRVYGKGYGETVPTDVAAGETLLPIQDGALFPPLGGTAIVALTPEGAQSDVIAFTGVVLTSGGSLVGSGSSPTTPPGLALAGGAGVDSGPHTLSVAYRTAVGQSLAGPPAAITAGIHPPPAAAATAGTATTGTGPDQGSHEYGVAFVTAYGETTLGPISNPITTSAAAGQLPAPSAPGLTAGAHTGNVEIGQHAYRVTYTASGGETEGGPAGSITTGGIGAAAVYSGPTSGTTGGALTPSEYYFYVVVFATASGESRGTVGGTSPGTYYLQLSPTQNAALLTGIPTSSNSNVIARKIYRFETYGNHFVGAYFLIGTIANNTATTFTDTMAQATAATGPSRTWNHLQTVDTTGPRTITVGIPIGPAGTTGRRVYRTLVDAGDAAPAYLVSQVSNNTATTLVDTKADAALGAECPTSNTTGTAIQRVPLSNIPIGPASVTARKLYRRFNGAGTFKLVTTIANNTGTTYNDAVANSALGADALGTATAVGNQILVTLPIGPAAVTTRELYLSPTSGAARRLISTIADNVTTAVTVATPDSAITGALEPAADTSGLQQPQGQVNPGAAVLPVASSAPFRAAGGWVTLGGGQVVRHGGISGNTLTGIPPAGSGAITTTVLYGQQAIPAPMLTGVTGLARPMLKGSAVHLWIQRDDLLAQAEHAARTGGDGIVEFLLVDTRRGVDSLADRCVADLALFSRPIITVAYATRDLLTKSGKTITVALPPPLAMQATVIIQEVTITEIDRVAGLAPRFTVKASSVRFSLEDTLRRLIAGGQSTAHA
jgi:hypothetical protein